MKRIILLLIGIALILLALVFCWITPIVDIVIGFMNSDLTKNNLILDLVKMFIAMPLGCLLGYLAIAASFVGK